MSRTITAEQIHQMRLKCTTDGERIVAYLWYLGDWTPTHALMAVESPFGWIGSAGHVRARELARGECAERLKGKVERARGGEIGLDPRFEYFRYAPQPKFTTADNAAAIKFFDDYPVHSS